MTWVLNAWRSGLSDGTRDAIRSLSVGELMDFTIDDMERGYVAELDLVKQFELASGTLLIALKPLP